MGAWRAAALASQFGFSVVGCMVGGVLLGLFLDGQFGTQPLLFLLGLVCGICASIYLIYVIYRMQIQPTKPSKSMAGVPLVSSDRTEPAESAE